MIGGRSPLPIRLGGGKSRTQQIFEFTKRAVGEGGSSGDDSGIEALWRSSRAKGLAAGESSELRALNQGWPHLATDAIPYYERILGLVPGPGATETERRAEIVPRWDAKQDSSIPGLTKALQAIDARFSIGRLDFDEATTTITGRAFAAHDLALEGPAFGGAGFSAYPFYSDMLIYRLLFAVGYPGPLLPVDTRLAEAAKTLVRYAIPATHGFSLHTSVGFILDYSSLDITGMNA